MVFDADGRILLVRNTYGDRRALVLPGGGVGLFETPIAAARREVREETRCRVENVVLFGRYISTFEGKRDAIWVFTARTHDTPIPDGREVAEAAFFALHALPEAASPATRRRISEYCGERAADSAW
ncbi:MAG: NUDIX domain-containing protein [Alphaproteobacteria bacterium]|nr:NUDIX domain-containing protein [Alphaproteobacteria bacterium]